MPNITTPNTQNVDTNIEALQELQLEDVSGGCHPKCRNNNFQPINIYNVNGNGNNGGPIPQSAPQYYGPQYYGPQYYGPQQSYAPSVQTDFSMQYR